MRETINKSGRMLSEAGQQILPQQNEAGIEFPGEKCIHELFEEQAERTPNVVAVEYEGQQLTYVDLNRKANQLAHYLRALGVKPESRVAICVERSLEMIIGLLGILKAGGAYVPLDPAYPQERLHYMLEESKPVALLTQAQLRERMEPLPASLPTFDLTDAFAWSNQPQNNPEAANMGLTTKHLAYVIYTSGSTGQPKGVLVEHANVVRLFAATDAWFHFNQNDVWTLFHSYAFDFSVWEIWGALLHGGLLIVVGQDTARSAEDFYCLVCRKRVTVLNQTPSAFRQLVAAQGRSEEEHGLRWVIFGGEALDMAMLRPWWERNPNGQAQLVNMYGITETTVHVTYRALKRADSDSAGSPIGCSIPDLRIYILNGEEELAPLGVAGELYIGGAGVARGYLQRPELTAERFVPDPYVEQAGARMYKTGDIGRWQADGEIEFVGRNDDQVKIRGFRIELGEITARLREHPSVEEAVVVAREDAPGEKQLVGYVILRRKEGLADGVEAAQEGKQLKEWQGIHEDIYWEMKGREGESSHSETLLRFPSNHPGTRDEVGRVMKELREYVRERLPEYMVPAAIVEMESLPLTSSGKLDRKALPAPEAGAYGIQNYQAPEGEIETVLADIWAELLQIRRVGRLDDFFVLGGHSLLAARAVTRIRQGLSVVVRVDDLFRNPVLADLARRLKGAARVELPPIVRSKQRDRFPLSLAQQRLWFLSQMDEVSRAYHVPMGLHLKGELDAEVLRRALDRMVARHETLRTTFVLIDGEPMQQIVAAADSRFHLLESDLRRHGDAKAEVNRLLMVEVNTSFNLETGPLIRGLLIRESEDEHTLLITMHHIVSDGWSLGVFRNEVSKLYSTFQRGQEDPLPELAVQYADFAMWERQWLEGEVLGQQCEYWKRTLQGVPALLELPADQPRPAQQDYRGRIEKLVLEQKLTSGLKELSRRQGTTLYMTLLAGWAALLSRLSGQAEIVIGTPVANRERADIEGLIGFFVNTLALRVDLSGQVTVKELLKRVKEVALGAQQNHNLPFERVVDIVGPERNLAHNPLFQVTFSWQNLPEGTIMLPEVEVKPLESIPYHAAKFDLALVLQEANGMIVGELEYANSLFDPATITRYLGYFRRLLDGMITDESGVVCRLTMLSQGEREQVLHQWNDTGIKFLGEKCIHELFAEQAERTPNAVAVEYEGQQLTYVDLNRKANQLAHYLRALGVKPESRVAICVERSLEMIIGLLGILKAGGAYMPLDPDYPRERLSYMLESAQVKVLLVQERLLRQMPEFAGAVVVLDGVEERQRLGEQRAENPEVKLEGENLAYIIYTSGSTGRPKGVVITHDALANHMAWMQKEFSLSAGERVLQKTAFGFDASVWEFYAPLLSGGCLIIARPGGQRDPEYMVSCIREQRVSVLQLVPTQLQMLLQHGGLRECGGLQRVYCGGEALSTEAVRELYAQLPTARLYNLYGPTETTIDSTFAECDHELRSITAPIGKAIANMRVYVVDEEMVPVPVGVPGELCLGGVGLARGYWGGGDLTAERFVPDGLSGRRGERLYRTGDLVRWLKDGNLEYLGRLDHQVKIRGFRIELGEITARLLEHPAVKESVVVAREDVPGEKRLIVYYSLSALHASHDQEPPLPDLRSFLCERLPEYMVPAVYVLMQSLPLTPNGKLDHKALPAPQGDAYGVHGYVPPQGDLETALAAIWAEVLRLEKVGRYDNFFGLGGQSLLALRVLFRVNDCFQTKLSVRAILEHPVLMEFVQKLDSASGRPLEQLEKIAGIWLRVRRMTSEELKAALTIH
jgi:amino acid adenylation domain-containing protein